MNRKGRYWMGMIVAALAGAMLAEPAGADHAGSLLDGGAVVGLSGRRGQEIVFRIHVEPGTDELLVATFGGEGDLDLYLSYEDRPSPRDHDYRSAGDSSDERIDVQYPRAGTWQLLVHGFRQFDGAFLVIHAGRGLIGQAEILSPACDHRWQMGQEHTIIWRAGPGVRSVRVQLSLDDGRTWLDAGLSVKVCAELGYLRFRLPCRPHGTYEARVRILDGSRGVVLDLSDRFIIPARPIVLARPRVIVVAPPRPKIPLFGPPGHKPPRRIEFPRPTPRPKVVVRPKPQSRVFARPTPRPGSDRKVDRKVDRETDRTDRPRSRRPERGGSERAGRKESPRPKIVVPPKPRPRAFARPTPRPKVVVPPAPRPKAVARPTRRSKIVVPPKPRPRVFARPTPRPAADRKVDRESDRTDRPRSRRPERGRSERSGRKESPRPGRADRSRR